MSGPRKGIDCGGLRTLAQLKAKSAIDPDTSCWEWQGPEEEDGAAAVSFYFGGRSVKRRGRRAALLLAGKTIPNGWVAIARPECKSLRCVNPEHARLVTAKEKMQQHVASGVFAKHERRVHLMVANAARAKTTLSQRIQIAQSTGSAKVVAAEYGISPERVRQLRKRPPVPTRGNSVFNLAA